MSPDQIQLAPKSVPPGIGARATSQAFDVPGWLQNWPARQDRSWLERDRSASLVCPGAGADDG